MDGRVDAVQQMRMSTSMGWLMARRGYKKGWEGVLCTWLSAGSCKASSKDHYCCVFELVLFG